MQDTKQKTKVKGAGCSDHPGPAVGSTWCASQRSISISSTTIITGNARLNTETGLNGEKAMNDLNTNGPLVELVAETTGALDELFEEIRLAVVGQQYSLPIRDSSRDSDDDSSDSDLDSYELRHRSPEVRLLEKQNAEIVAVDTIYHFKASKNYSNKQNTDGNSDPRPELHSWSLELEQPEWPSDRMLSSDTSLRPGVSNSELYQSINDEEMSPSSVRNAWLSSKSMFWSASFHFSHSDLQLSADDEKLSPINVIQTPSKLGHWLSSHSEFQFFTGEEDLSAINVIETPSKLGHWLSSHSVYTSVDKLPRTSTLKPTWLIDLKKKLGYHSKPLWPTSREIQGINQTWLSDSDLSSSSYYLDLASEECNDATEAAAPKCWSFLSALGRRVMSACRKLICCGGCGRNHKMAGKKTK